MQTCRQTSGCENRSWKNKKNLLSCSLGRLSNCWQRCFPYIKKKNLTKIIGLLSNVIRSDIPILHGHPMDSPCVCFKCQGLLYQFMERRRALSQLWRMGTYSPFGLPWHSLSAHRGKNSSSALCSFFSSSRVLQKPAYNTDTNINAEFSTA